MPVEDYSYWMKTKPAAAILIAVVMLLTVSLAQQSSPVADPEAERILDKAAQAEGNDNVLGSLRTLRLTGVPEVGDSLASLAHLPLPLPRSAEPETAILLGRTHQRDAANQLVWTRLQAKCPVPSFSAFHRWERDVAKVRQRPIGRVRPGHRVRKKANYFPMREEYLGPLRVPQFKWSQPQSSCFKAGQSSDSGSC